MKTTLKVIAALLLVTQCTLTMGQELTDKIDSRALAILKQMSDYKASFDQWSLKGYTSKDARLDNGLLVANTEEVIASIMRPGSAHVRRFNGVSASELFIHDGQLTLFDESTGFYAQADTPKELDEAMEFALEEFDIDVPLMDLLMQDTYGLMVEAADEILYLSDKARIGGVDCHHIVLRTNEVDMQMWIEEGDKPLPRRVMITAKWEGGAPRYIGNMSWDISPNIPDKAYRFIPPKGSSQIELVSTLVDQGGK